MRNNIALQQLWSCDEGAAKGIGLACASCLGHEGAKVVVADLDEEGAKRSLTAFMPCQPLHGFPEPTGLHVSAE